MFGARSISILDIALGVLLAVTAYGGVAAIAFTLSNPPFSMVFGLPRWTVFAAFTASGMALTATLLMSPIFLIVMLALRRRRAAGPVRILLAGVISATIGAAIFSASGEFLNAAWQGDVKRALFPALMVGVVLAVFVQFAAWLRRRPNP